MTFTFVPATPPLPEAGPDLGVYGVYQKSDHRRVTAIVDFSENKAEFKRYEAHYKSTCHVLPLLQKEWKDRENILTAHRRYRACPDFFPKKAEHFARVAGTKNELVAFFASEAHGMIGRLTEMKPGKYITKFFPTYDAQKITDAWVEEFSDAEVRFTNDADQVEWVYNNGPASCMAYRKESHWPNLPEHPTRVYHGGDLKIAYIKKGERVSARTVVWPDKKIYSTIYGDSAKLKPALERLGYSQGVFEGARIRKIPYDYTFVIPFSDGTRYFKEENDFLVLTNNQTPRPRSASGYPEGATRCAFSNKITDTADRVTYFNQHGNSGYASKKAIEAASEKPGFCEHSKNYYHPSRIGKTRDGKTFSLAYLNNRSYKKCNADGRYYPASEVAPDPAGNGWLASINRS